MNKFMMQQAQKLQAQLLKAQEELANVTVEASSGGGAVTVVMTGHQRVQSIAVNQEALDLDDEEWLNDLQDLLVVAMNQAVEQSQMMAAEKMERITGGLGNIPGLGGLLG